MIKEIRVTNLDKSCISWWNDVAFLKDRKSLKFKPGLNLIVGPNGTGKSTILRLIARWLHCEQGGVQAVTDSSVGNIRVFGGAFQTGIRPIHDGSPIVYFDPDNKVGTFGGEFDWDFGMEGVQNTLFKGSSGEAVIHRIIKALEALVWGKFPEVKWKTHLEDKTKKKVSQWLRGTGKKERPTVLLDEPARALDLDKQITIWVRIAQAKNVQVIVATHSVFAFFVPGAHIIETEEGFAKTVRRAITGFLDEEVPQKLIDRKPKLKHKP